MADFTAGIRKAKVQEAIRSKIQLHFQGNEETTPAPWRCHCIATPDQFYKGRSQEKTLLPRLEVFLLLSPYDRARVVRTYRPCARLRGTVAQRFGFSLPAVFIASWQRSLSVPKPAKQNVVKFGDHSSIGDSWPIAFSGYPRGPSLDYSRFCWRKKKRCSKRWMNTGF